MVLDLRFSFVRRGGLWMFPVSRSPSLIDGALLPNLQCQFKDG